MMQKIILKTISVIVILLLTVSGLNAQDDNYYDPGFVRNENVTYRKNIKTVLLYKAGFELSPPMIGLNSGEKIVLYFDDLDAEYKSYYYTLVHCDAYWNTSGISPIEYIEGFTEDEIDDYRFSYNTTIPYINYHLEFPTEDLRLKKSGNYIIKVYTDSDKEENIVLTRRIMVYDTKVDVEGRIVNTMDLSLRYTHQQVNFKILTRDFYLTDTYRNLHVMIMQNGRWDNMIRDVQPRIISGNEFDFSSLEQVVFPAGNEFRYFDMKTLKYNTDRMESLQYTSEGYQVYLMTDMPRANGNYHTEEDINGRRLIAANNSRDPHTEGDYARVHFLLPYWPPIAEGNLYVAGELNDWNFDTISLMRYNFDLRAYQAGILLKQGYYNYEYAFLENGKKSADISLIEGSYRETVNEYTIYVYYREPGDLYDQLVGIGFVNSLEN
jgi:hypothetical protein